MRARGASRAMQYLTRSGSMSTRMSPRGHGFDMGEWDESQGEPPQSVEALTPTPTREERLATHNALADAQQRAGALGRDLSWFRRQMGLVVSIIMAGEVDGAQWLARALHSLPSDLSPSTSPIVAARWVRESVAENANFREVPIPPRTRAALDEIEKAAEAAQSALKKAAFNRRTKTRSQK